jgi:hypothetical protein
MPSELRDGSPVLSQFEIHRKTHHHYHERRFSVSVVVEGKIFFVTPVQKSTVLPSFIPSQ